MADKVDRNHERIMTVRKHAASIISIIDGLSVYEGDLEDLDDPFYSEIEYIGSDIDQMKEEIDAIE